MRLEREITCAQLVELLTDYLEDELSADDRERVEEHLVFCDGCSSYLDQMRQTISVTGRLQPDDLPPALVDKLLAAFREWSPE